MNLPPRDHTPSFSEPPINVKSHKGERSANFADVAMRLVHDGPMYAIIALVGILAFKGHATSTELMITSLGALLARSWPRAVQIGGGGAVALVLFLSSCSGVSPRPASYGAELTRCNVEAKTCQESIDCENQVRLKYPLADGGPRALREGGCD